MSFLDFFSGHADLYVAARPRYPDELFTFIASQSSSHNFAWDCGTGNGQAATSLSNYFSQVFASDPSTEQISHAIKKSNIHYSVQRAESTNFPDRYFDAICVAQALHWFDFTPFFSEVHRVAAPGALFVAWGYDWFSVSPDFDAAFNLTVLDVIEPYWASQNQLLWNGYIDVPFPFPRISTPKLQVHLRWNFYQLLAYVRTWSATQRCIAANGMAFFESAECILGPLWGNPETEKNISMLLHVVAGRLP